MTTFLRRTLIANFGRRLYSVRPPSYFSDVNNIPEEFPIDKTTSNGAINDSVKYPTGNDFRHDYDTRKQQREYDEYQDNSGKSIKELSSLIAMCGLTYIAVDNYINRIELQRSLTEIAAINQLKLHEQKVLFVSNQQKKEVRMLQERRDSARRAYKLTLHIALLRKQLEDAGIEPATIADALKEFESHVKVDNLSRNLGNLVFWLDDDSELKAYVPEVIEYDKRRVSSEK